MFLATDLFIDRLTIQNQIVYFFTVCQQPSVGILYLPPPAVKGAAVIILLRQHLLCITVAAMDIDIYDSEQNYN